MAYKKIDTQTQPLGFPLDADTTLEFMQSAASATVEGLAKLVGDNIIISGCQEAGGIVAPGWIMLNGELLPFAGGAVSNGIKVVVNETVVSKANKNGVVLPRYYTREAQFGATGTNLWADFKRGKTSNELEIGEQLATATAVNNVNTKVLALFGSESAIILLGCGVVDLGTDQVQVGSGIAMFGNKMQLVPSYTGVAPVYLKEDGTYVTTTPTTGLYITFDKRTSQYYRDVLKRWISPVGEIKMMKVLPDAFDGTGVGRWEWKGFKICDDLSELVPIGYSRNNASDCHVVGDELGNADFVVTQQNIQKFSISKPAGATDSGTGNPMGTNLANDGAVTYDVGVDNPTPISTRQPSKVIVYLERI